MAIVFWLSAAIVTLAYVGYPMLMACAARIRPRPVKHAAQTPSIDVLVVVHNAAGLVETKLSNLLALDYPADRIRIHLVCDGCDDDTESLAQSLATDARVHVVAYAQRRGKSACIADMLPSLGAELVLFTDIRQRLDCGAARSLAAAFADPNVGAASGELVIEADTGYGKGIGAYWRYEKFLRRLETASGSIIGATGALYAARRSLLRAPPYGIVLDDMWIPLAIAAGGHRVVFAPHALAFDRGAQDSRGEESRKRRTLAGNYQLLHLWPQLAVPGLHPLALRLWGHKWLRLAAPWCLMLILVSNVWLARDSEILYTTMLALQVIAYALALCGRLIPVSATAWLPVRLCSAFFSLNLSAMLALIDYLRNPQAHLWSNTRMEAAGK